MTYNADLDPNATAVLSHEEEVEAFIAEFPEWEVSEGYGDRFIAEADVVLPDPMLPTDADWQAFYEMTYSEFFREN